MIGMKISRYGKDVQNARMSDFIVNTELESLPIYWQGEFELLVIPAGADGGLSTVRINHNFDYQPLALGWIDTTLSTGETVRAKLPVFSSDNWVYELYSRKDGVYVKAEYAAPDPSAIPNFRVKGYLYIFEKDVRKA